MKNTLRLGTEFPQRIKNVVDHFPNFFPFPNFSNRKPYIAIIIKLQNNIFIRVVTLFEYS